jgi:hypothetical protein
MIDLIVKHIAGGKQKAQYKTQSCHVPLVSNGIDLGSIAGYHPEKP